MAQLEPDDLADHLQSLPDERRQEALAALPAHLRKEVLGLLGYAKDSAGGIMTPRFVAFRPEMSVADAMGVLRIHARNGTEFLDYGYVVDPNGVLVGVTGLRELLANPPEAQVASIMRRDVIRISETEDQERVALLLAHHDLFALPVVDRLGRIRGIVTSDDLMDVLEDEVTEDFQKISGSEAAAGSYFSIGTGEFLRKRGTWLIGLLVVQMLTINVLALFERELEEAMVLALFIPVIMHSGGNAGTQAATWVVRGMAVEQIQQKDWWRTFGREALNAVSIGLVMGLLILARVLLWPPVQPEDVEQASRLALTISVTLIAVVIWGNVLGAMLPFVLRVLRADPASASNPLVTTIIDVTSLMIFFAIGKVLL